MIDPGSFVVATATEPTVEAQEAAVPQASPATEENFGARFAHLARKERELQKQAEGWKKEKETYQTQLKELEELKQWRTTREQTPEDIGELLSSRGLDFEKVAQYFMDGGKPSAETLIAKTKKELEEKFDRYESERLEKESKEAEAKADQQRKAFLENVTRFSGENGFELIEATKSEELVFSVMEEAYQKTGKILDLKEACELVESHLEEQELEKFSKLKKLRAKLGIADLEQDPAKAQEQNAQGLSAPRTLNARMTQVAQPQAKIETFDKEALKREAAKQLRWV